MDLKILYSAESSQIISICTLIETEEYAAILRDEDLEKSCCVDQCERRSPRLKDTPGSGKLRNTPGSCAWAGRACGLEDYKIGRPRITRTEHILSMMHLIRLEDRK